MTAITGQNVAPPIAGSRRELPAALVRLVHEDVSESAWVRPAPDRRDPRGGGQ